MKIHMQQYSFYCVYQDEYYGNNAVFM